MEDTIPTTTATTISEVVSWLASATASAIDALPTDLDGDGGIPLEPPVGGDEMGPDSSEGSYFLNTLIGFLIIIISSMVNALGLNITKLDHIRQQAIPRHERRRDYLRILWLAGMGMYIASQALGSPLALKYLRPDWVAPLGSTALIFNFIFARWLVGTPVTATDIRGTAVIVLGVILIMVFSSINHGLQQSITIERLNGLWRHGGWLSYFFFIVAATFLTFLITHLFAKLLASRASYSPIGSPSLGPPLSRPRPSNPVVGFFKRSWAIWKGVESRILGRMDITFSRTDDARIIWLQGIGWAVAGGSLAGLCLVFTKAVVKIFYNPGHPLLHPTPFVTLLFVIITAVCQIICLNKALQCADTVVVVPLFYAGYTVLGFINSLIFYDEAGQYEHWVLVMVFLSISVLISGVVLLSLKSSAKSATDPYTVSTRATPSMRLNPRSRVVSNTKSQSGSDHDQDELEGEQAGSGSSDRPKRDEVMWEVGSVSDDEDEHRVDGDQEVQPQGLGEGSGRGQGERRGLLDEEDEIEGEEEDDRIRGKGKNVDEEDEGFGEYGAVPVLTADGTSSGNK